MVVKEGCQHDRKYDRSDWSGMVTVTLFVIAVCLSDSHGSYERAMDPYMIDI